MAPEACWASLSGDGRLPARFRSDEVHNVAEEGEEEEEGIDKGEE